MVQSLKLLAAAALMAAPAPALAQPALAAFSSGASQAADASKDVLRPQWIIVVKDKQGFERAVFHPRLAPALPKVQRSSETRDQVPEIEIPPKDIWTDKQGLRIAVNKIRYTRSF